jgi:hypothetical protein
MTKPVNVAIVGGGLMGREIAAALQRWPALIDHPVRPQLTAVCDINPAALDWFDQIPAVTRTVTDYADLLADDAIDVLYIAVRHDLHRQLYVDTIQPEELAAEAVRHDAGRKGDHGGRSGQPALIRAVLQRDAVFPGRTGGRQLRAVRRPGPDHRGPLRLPARQ